MSRRILGLETEFAGSLLTNGSAVENSQAAKWLMAELSRREPNLPCRTGAGIFLRNGGRMYVDCAHIEYATPETEDPWEMCRHARAGERVLGKLAAAIATERPGTRAIFSRCNVCYATGVTWGCHENYSHRAPTAWLAPNLVPFLVSRVIFTGAGGFDILRSGGLRFTLSPKVPYLFKEVSDSSTSERGIFHSKDEPLACAEWHRLHVQCGEALSSDTSLWLRSATTAVVVALVEAGFWPGRKMAPTNPIQAIRAVSADPTLRARIPMLAGPSMTAIEIQRRYLALARRQVGKPFMPPWSAEVCEAWEHVLSRLERGPDAVDTVLDWAIKRRLYNQFTAEAGFTEQDLGFWDAVLGTLERTLRSARRDGVCAPMGPEMLQQPGLVQEVLRQMADRLGARERAIDELPRILALRDQLWELDFKFGLLTGEGLFAMLDSQGILRHAVAGVEPAEGEEASAFPPAHGRARLRGEIVSRLASADAGRYVAYWTEILDRNDRRMLDLNDPFVETERWVPIPPGQPAA